MKQLTILLLAGLASLSISPSLGAEDSTREGGSEKARVVCFGDSITKRGYPEILATELGVETVNAGVAGHSSAQGLRRMKKDVLERNPDVVVIFFGTNDARVDSDRVHVPVKDYEKNLIAMVKAIRKEQADVVICTLPPINEKTYYTRHDPELYEKAGGTEILWRSYREAAMRVAEKYTLPVVDLYTELQDQPEWMHRDGVHPSPEGNEIIATLVAVEVSPLVSK